MSSPYEKSIHTNRVSDLGDLPQIAADLEMIIKTLLKEGAEEFRVTYDTVDDVFVVHALQLREPISHN